jgi:hypothetical protein
MRLGLRQKLVLGGLAIVVVVSFGFTLLQLALSRQSVEEDLQARAVFFAREVAASIGDRRELQGGARLERQIRQIMGVRRSVLQLDIIAFRGEDADIVATSDPRTRLPFTRADTDQVRLGKVVSRLVANEGGRYSTKRSARGTGLGLFISAQIVREHKGRIDVASEEDLGSTFAVRLPVDGAVA